MTAMCASVNNLGGETDSEKGESDFRSEAREMIIASVGRGEDVIAVMIEVESEIEPTRMVRPFCGGRLEESRTRAVRVWFCERA